MYPHDSSLLSDITPNRQPSTANSAKSKAQRSSLCKCLSAHPGSGIKREEICVLCTYTHNHCKYKYIHTSVSITCVNVYIVKKTSIYLTVYIYMIFIVYTHLQQGITKQQKEQNGHQKSHLPHVFALPPKIVQVLKVLLCPFPTSKKKHKHTLSQETWVTFVLKL